MDKKKQEAKNRKNLRNLFSFSTVKDILLVIKSIDKNSREVFLLRYPIDDNEPKSIFDISKELNMSVENTKEMLEKIKSEIKQLLVAKKRQILLDQYNNYSISDSRYKLKKIISAFDDIIMSNIMLMYLGFLFGKYYTAGEISSVLHLSVEEVTEYIESANVIINESMHDITNPGNYSK